MTRPASGNADPGYHLLSYNPLNYCTSCKSCNSPLKGDNFPIEGTRSSGGDDPVQLGSEKPLLVNPVGDFDDDPATLISFHGLSPMAIGDSDYKKRRGLVIIAFFHLDDRRRKYLFGQRAEIIVSLHSFLMLANLLPLPDDKATYKDLVEEYTKPSSPHTNCARSFVKLFETNQAEADEIFKGASAYIKSTSS